MSTPEDCLLKAKSAVASLRTAAIDSGVGNYFRFMGNQDCPSAGDLAAARDAADAAMKDRVCSAEWLSAINDGKPVTREETASRRLSFNAVAPSLTVPPPQTISYLSPARLGIAAAVGAIGGMMILAPLARVLLDMRDTGVFVGAPLGAFLLVLAAWHAANNTRLRQILCAAFGVATIFELWGILTGGGVLRQVWARIGGRYSGVKRIALYLCCIFVLCLARPRSRYDRSSYEQAVRSALEQWVDGAIMALSALSAPVEQPSEPERDFKGMLCILIGKVQFLQHVPTENLRAAVQELHQEVRNLGFTGESSQTFEWQEDSRNTYETFGHVEPGTRVDVEREPVCFRGQVLVKGLARKRRDGR